MGLRLRIGRWHINRTAGVLSSPDQARAVGELIVVAPDYGSAQPLPAVADELRALARFARFRQPPARYDALRELFGSAADGIIHFAGHGRVDADGPIARYSIRLQDGDLDLRDWHGLFRDHPGHPFVFFDACDIGQADRVAEFVEGWARMQALLDTGKAAWQRADDRAALAAFEQGLALAREARHLQGKAAFNNAIGVVLDNLGRDEEALAHYGERLAIDRELRDRDGEGEALTNIGIVYNSLGRYQEALEHYTQALTIASELGDRRGEGADLGNIANPYSNVGRHQEAMAHRTRALVIHRETADEQAKLARLIAEHDVVSAGLERLRAERPAYFNAIVPAPLKDAAQAFAEAPGNKRALIADLSARSGQLTGLLQVILLGDRPRLLLTTPEDLAQHRRRGRHRHPACRDRRPARGAHGPRARCRHRPKPSTPA